MKTYILTKHGVPVPEPDLQQWSEWMEHTRHQLVMVTQHGRYRISTCFLGVSHGLVGSSPILWETMLFSRGGALLKMRRCPGTQEQAEAMHSEFLRSFLEDQPFMLIVWWLITRTMGRLLGPLKRRMIKWVQKLRIV